MLKKESEIPLEDLLKELPPDYLEDRSKSMSPASKEVAEVCLLQLEYILPITYLVLMIDFPIGE